MPSIANYKVIGMVRLCLGTRHAFVFSPAVKLFVACFRHCQLLSVSVVCCRYMSLVETIPSYGVHYYEVKVGSKTEL